MNLIKKLKKLGFKKHEFVKTRIYWSENEKLLEVVEDTQIQKFSKEFNRYYTEKIKRRKNHISWKYESGNVKAYIRTINDRIADNVIVDIDGFVYNYLIVKKEFKDNSDVIGIFPKKIQRQMKLNQIFKQ